MPVDNIDLSSPLLTPGGNVNIPAAATAVEITLPLAPGAIAAIPVLKSIILTCVTAGSAVGRFVLGHGPAGGPYAALAAFDTPAFAVGTTMTLTFPKGWAGDNLDVFTLTPSAATLGVWRAVANGYFT